MNPMPELTPMLKELRLSGVMDSLEQRNRLLGAATIVGWVMAPIRWSWKVKGLDV